MSMKFTSGKIDFELGTSTAPAPLETRDATPFCIAILGDFSGRTNRGLSEPGPSLAARRLFPVDVDNFERLPAKLGTEIHIPLAGADGPHVTVAIAELGDFHPDRIFDRLELFQELKAVRGRLQNPATFADAASQVRSWVTDTPDTPKPKPQQTAAPQAQTPQEADTETIERLLGRQPTSTQPPRTESRFIDIDALIREAVKPYVVPAPHPQQADIVAQVDRAITGQMRTILHHPQFQQLEAAWRILDFLVSQIETDETLKLYVVDVSKAELAADLAAPDSLRSAGAYRLLVEQSVAVYGAQPWAILLGIYSFDQTKEDLALLRRLAGLAQAAGAPFLAAAHPHFAGCRSFADTPDPDDWQWQPDPEADNLWQQLRSSPEAVSVGLVLPRFLLRLPYGKDTESIDRFDFHEQPHPPEHERYLWGNSAAVCTCLLADAFRESGWVLTDQLRTDLTGLPMHVYKADAQTRVTPCAETVLTERAMQILVEKGLIPLLSIKGRDTVRIARFQSVAKPSAPLAGRWR